jgi:hypothetical protein
MTAVQHIIVTRFSTKLRGQEYADGIPLAWLEQRLGLFERWCLPSMARQSCPDFTWLVLCDESTDPGIRDRLEALGRTMTQLRVTILDESISRQRALQQAVDAGAGVVVTTRLDSDDALNVAAVETLQDYARCFAAGALASLIVNFERGWQLQTETGIVTERWYPHSPFLSLIERAGRGSIRGVMHGPHTEVPYAHPTHQDLSIVGWLQTVHGDNVANQITDPDLAVRDADLSAFGIAGDGA